LISQNQRDSRDYRITWRDRRC